MRVPAKWRFVRPSRWVVLVIVLFSIQGCSNLSYYQQAISGQYSVLSQRVDIDDILADKTTPAPLKTKLKTVLQIRAFAAAEMQMDIGDSYSQYADLNRDFVVWNITATPELSLTPHQWCYPIIGCQNYRGYFHQSEANNEALQLQQQGMDTWVGGVSAYSTLGWFDDPVLNTFVYREDSDLAALLIHELSHQILYIQGDTSFNESFATAVELEGMQRWLISNGQSALFNQYKQKLSERALFIETVLDSIDTLKTIYDAESSTDTKRFQKKQVISAMSQAYQRKVTKRELSGYYTGWFKQLNNAKLITVSNYYQYVPAFSAMIDEAEGNMSLFYQRAIELSQQNKETRDSRLKTYLSEPPI